MKVFPIVKYPAEILTLKAAPIEKIPEHFEQFITQMVHTMYKADGVGLAAPQINISQQIIIVQDVEHPEKAYPFLNPSISSRSKKQETVEEGCLSLPGIFVPVKRAESVEITCYTPDMKEIHLQASGLAARIFQHEVDHLQGKLIIDRIQPWRRLKLRKQLKELKNTSA